MIFHGADLGGLDIAPSAKRSRRMGLALIGGILGALLALAMWASGARAQMVSPDQVVGGNYNTTLPTYSDKQRSIFQTDNRGRIYTIPVTGSTADGASAYFLQPAASDNHATILARAGTVYAITAFNNSATINYLRLYNATTGFNGCNSATGLITQMQIPASTAVGGFTVSYGPTGLAFSTGVSICVSSGYATNDTTAATATAMSITVTYK